MLTIAKREFYFFFNNISGYLVLIGFLTVNTLMLWFFDTPFNLLNIGFGNFSPFFELSPWLFLFLIPALSMRSFSEELSSGTFELLLTKPLKPSDIFGGKLIGLALVLGIVIILTLINLVALSALIEPNSNLDWGSIMGSYLAIISVGLIFLVIGLCSSIMFRNQVTSFLVCLLACFSQFYLWSFIADFTSIPWLYKFICDIGIQDHYLSLSRGIILFEDIIYFIGMFFVFFIFGMELIKKEQN
jgi:ABC-2 type transport system permease protein